MRSTLNCPRRIEWFCLIWTPIPSKSSEKQPCQNSFGLGFLEPNFCFPLNGSRIRKPRKSPLKSLSHSGNISVYFQFKWEFLDGFSTFWCFPFSFWDFFGQLPFEIGSQAPGTLAFSFKRHQPKPQPMQGPFVEVQQPTGSIEQSENCLPMYFPITKWTMKRPAFIEKQNSFSLELLPFETSEIKLSSVSQCHPDFDRFLFFWMKASPSEAAIHELKGNQMFLSRQKNMRRRGPVRGRGWLKMEKSLLFKTNYYSKGFATFCWRFFWKEERVLSWLRPHFGFHWGFKTPFMNFGGKIRSTSKWKWSCPGICLVIQGPSKLKRAFWESFHVLLNL